MQERSERGRHTTIAADRFPSFVTAAWARRRPSTMRTSKVPEPRGSSRPGRPILSGPPRRTEGAQNVRSVSAAVHADALASLSGKELPSWGVSSGGGSSPRAPTRFFRGHICSSADRLRIEHQITISFSPGCFRRCTQRHRCQFCGLIVRRVHAATCGLGTAEPQTRPVSGPPARATRTQAGWVGSSINDIVSPAASTRDETMIQPLSAGLSSVSTRIGRSLATAR